MKLLIDFNHLAIRTLFAPNGMDKNSEEFFPFHKHLVLSTIFSNIKKFEPTEVILAVDDKQNWRKKVYPEYKANRKLARDASEFSWDKYFIYMDEFLDSITDLPFKVLRVPFCEADDVIAVISKYHQQTCTIVTSDSDYIQLLQYKHIKLYDPLKKKFIEDKDPLKTLKIKIIKGDSGDNIPGIKTRVGEKTAIKLIENNELDNFLKDDIINNNYNRNEKLISFNHIPSVVQKEILNKYNNYTFKKEHLDYHSWFVNHKLRDLTSKLQVLVPVLKKLESKSTLMDIF